jgi:AcrR family transcriptional regulator
MTAKERKRAIVQSALPLFARRGFAETTTRDLARAAGVSEPLLYKHFPSKEALYLEIQNVSCRETDPVVRRLTELEPSTSTLVHLVYYLMRALILGRPLGSVEWETRHRLMLKSFLEDGAYARLVFKNRFAGFCSRMESCLKASIAAGETVAGPVPGLNGARFAHHLGGWLALSLLPRKAVIDYKSTREELLHQAVWFVLRGMGMTDHALATYYNPKALALSFSED